MRIGNDSKMVPALMKKQSERATGQPEHWSTDGGNAATVVLHIPADAQRERDFEIAVAMTVRPHATAKAPSHELKVFADGELQWSRRIQTNQPAEYDSLDYRFSRRVPVGRALRLQVHADCRGGQRLKTVIEADEI